MNKLALLMAGGDGCRMRQSGVETIKPLVSVAGITLLERNVQQLIKYGFDKIIISVNEHQREIKEFIEKNLRPFVDSMDTSLVVIEEKIALGNIGSARFLEDYKQDVLVVYADNITSLNLMSIYNHHINEDVAMTIAVHKQPFKMPFGEIKVTDNYVSDYDEKPTIEFTVCSAISVLSPTAIKRIPSNKIFGISDLVKKLIAEKLNVLAFKHDDLWIDVNDHSNLLKVESMINENIEKFEIWSPQIPISGGVIDLTDKKENVSSLIKTQQIDSYYQQLSLVKRWSVQYYKNDVDVVKKARLHIHQSKST